MVFGLGFLIANKLDFILSDELVRWQGVEIDIYNNNLLSQQKESNVIDKRMLDDIYKRHTGQLMAVYKNVLHPNNEKKGQVRERDKNI